MKAARHKLSLAVQFACKQDDEPTRAEIRAWAAAALEGEAEVTVRLVDEDEGCELNREYRGKDYATNVLSFVYQQELPCQGDLVLCAPVVSREAVEQGKSVEAHYAHLVVHGMLHLQGYDHENEDDALEMEAVETHIMRKLGYTDPYAV
ncbi:endoribonuclease YbeY [Sulfurimicrobium lacus]|uniref:Endoribonuclease YbeY n=1 Tax=Sulfurimicrobium lacus TaxID=2715678 RepID=A0A6F8V9S3_9PROT|nr:rRNA maturation RNase YbeY [Sulfurimicrobium lacus]BCB25515.1 endoribonuclease YbeY [Sulfurimicrobium lacus]